MELLQLRYFYDCARLGSIAKTAEKYMVPASSISASVRRLEGELGSKLFDRTSNRIALNENGKRLKKSLEKIFSELDQTVTDITCPFDDTRIKLLVRTIRTNATDYIVEYRKKHPNVAFEFVMDQDNGDFSDYDVIIDARRNIYGDYEWFEMRNRRVYLRAAADHPLSGRELTMKQLKDQPFVTMGGNMHEMIVRACNEAGFTPNVIAKINDITCYRKVLLSGIAIGHGRENSAGPGEGFCYLNVTDFDQRQSTCVYYKAGATGSIKNFIEFLKTKCD